MRALISVSDKTGIVDFAKGLVALGYEIISTGGTHKALADSGLNVIAIDEVTEFPEMLNGRVKTLHPKIHGGLLALRENETHMATCKDHNIELIDLVVVNLYPFEATVAKPGVTREDAIENIDIGGPSMLRSAAKNHQSVGIVVNPERYTPLLTEMQSNAGRLTDKTRRELAIEVFQTTAKYDAAICNYLEQDENPDTFPRLSLPVLNKVSDLRYGENPHQQAAFYTNTSLSGLSDMEQLHGKELSYNNIVDLESAWHIVREFDTPAVTVIKHTNPCGTAIGESHLEAYEKALAADPVSAFGSIIGVNGRVEETLAQAISKLFVEAVIAPGFSDEALAILTQKPSIRLIALPNFFDTPNTPQLKYVQGGYLLQAYDTKVVDKDALKVVTTAQPSDAQQTDLEFAFAVCKHVKSNAIVLVKDGVTVGVGAGQMSRVEAVEIAIKKAGDKAQGSVCASDAFFPFGDSIALLSDAGISAVIQPGGSKRDQESIDASNDKGVSMVFTGMRHFKH
ncbi:bifunctional phosphoribosylaminoimidazolecarboxamide formyltransferase/IMP cyclohydrolase [bacterium]|jgi:phosphoribosylaminoimidazolecarboxamide formyltransferase / IMP cyclohydrolase|nr:bifunctional phosphoribosylaminoimidazolecarboxamide formyltransferase/IMP cyclohydrolase [bacterium]